MNVETPAWRGLENSAGGRVQDHSDTERSRSHVATIADVLAGHRFPHELPGPQHDLYRLGFRDGCNRMQETVYDLQRQVSWWYAEATNPAESRARHAELLKAFDVALARKTSAEQWAELDRIAAQRAEAAR